jgi:hypothetical protein
MHRPVFGVPTAPFEVDETTPTLDAPPRFGAL